MGLDLDQLGAVDVLDEDTTLGEIELHTRPTLRFHGSIPALTEQLKNLMKTETRIVLAAPHQGDVERLATVLREYQIPYRLGSRAHAARRNHAGRRQLPGRRSARAGDCAHAAGGGRESSRESNLIVFGANDLSDEADVAARPEPKRSKTAAFVSDFRDLAVGDYVVHVEHGIAQYQGLKEIAQDGLSVEFMILEFAEGAKLYVPLTRLDLIQKYRSTDTGPAPVLNRLGSQQWAKTKARVRKAMQDMAAELLKLYAERHTAEGTAFSKDNEFQREFEDAFDYSETDDQMAAIRAIKYDMESTTPMDRLLCGDVGYGKTEVAMRAAFKAVQDGKQVAVLTPTTILSFQHFETFKQRFAQFPIHIEMISRFRTAKEQKDIVERVETGKVDILIGTHRLLSKDIKFQDLGLLVVDEEQRFGVRHKERLKQMRKEIDVLAMSATPIPRTLHMSLVGLRDMSVIETPPKDRMAIQTVVAKFDEKIIRSAVEVELERGGQVYLRAQSRGIDLRDRRAHSGAGAGGARGRGRTGRWAKRELEKVMLAFMRHEFDVLVATTIIENGLDIPLANTILINRADRHGLSELYQLRGRVGRSNRRAYAYLLIPPENRVDGDCAAAAGGAEGVFSDLGAGFKIAALDLELRGAGNMLGGEQSGHIEAVGFELYTSMLEAAVKELKGEGSRRAAGHAAQSGHRAAHRRELRARREPAPAALQEDCRRDERSGDSGDSRRDGRPLRRAARSHSVSAGGGAVAPGVRTHGRSADRSQAQRIADSLYRECRGRSHASDEAGGAQRQTRRAVYAAGFAEVSAEGGAVRRSSAGDSRSACGAGAGAGGCVRVASQRVRVGRVRCEDSSGPPGRGRL